MDDMVTALIIDADTFQITPFLEVMRTNLKPN